MDKKLEQHAAVGRVCRMAMPLPIPGIHIDLKISNLLEAALQADMHAFKIRSGLAVPFAEVDDLGFPAVGRQPARAILAGKETGLNLDLGLATRNRFP